MDHLWVPTATNRWQFTPATFPWWRFQCETTIAAASMAVGTNLSERKHNHRHSTPSASFCKFCMFCFLVYVRPTQPDTNLSSVRMFMGVPSIQEKYMKKLRCRDSQYPEHKKIMNSREYQGKRPFHLYIYLLFQDFHRFPWFSPLPSYIFFERPLLRCLRHRCSVRRHSASGPAAAALGSGQLLRGKRAKSTACNEIGAERGWSYGYLDIKHTWSLYNEDTKKIWIMRVWWGYNADKMEYNDDVIIIRK